MLVGCLHLAYFCTVNAKWRWTTVAQHVAGVLFGLGLQLALITLVHPGWISELKAGAALFSYDTGGKQGGMINDFRWDIQRLIR